MIPQALQFGMTLNDFLYEDEDLFHAYQKAYFNKTSFDGWIYGMYNCNAQSVSLNNAFSKNKEETINYINKPITYIEKNDVNNNEKKYLTPLEEDQRYRDMMLKYY